MKPNSLTFSAKNIQARHKSKFALMRLDKLLTINSEPLFVSNACSFKNENLISPETSVSFKKTPKYVEINRKSPNHWFSLKNQQPNSICTNTSHVIYSKPISLIQRTLFSTKSNLNSAALPDSKTLEETADIMGSEALEKQSEENNAKKKKNLDSISKTKLRIKNVASARKSIEFIHKIVSGQTKIVFPELGKIKPFNAFCLENGNDVSNLYGSETTPTLQFQLRYLISKWNNLSHHEKLKYQERANQLNDHFLQFAESAWEKVDLSRFELPKEYKSAFLDSYAKLAKLPLSTDDTNKPTSFYNLPISPFVFFLYQSISSFSKNLETAFHESSFLFVNWSYIPTESLSKHYSEYNLLLKDFHIDIKNAYLSFK
ncbi:hypothetical protein BB560_002674 [Smittium megazygosporum]|uniref:Uncharacterized protein n=1 Tax=Smittium megazygosporum TaxID=133381 RepID=A0A2T9ZE48_9FUNG|nr:hypothetical protein BB560_002674 [Smittium megazygosporum]